MKILTTLIILTVLDTLPSKGQSMEYQSIVDVQSDTNVQISNIAHDVLVTHEGGKYIIQINVKQGDHVRTYGASVGSDKSFDKASYTWVSNNRVDIKLFSQNSPDIFELKVWGQKGTAGMQVETKDAD